MSDVLIQRDGRVVDAMDRGAVRKIIDGLPERDKRQFVTRDIVQFGEAGPDVFPIRSGVEIAKRRVEIGTVDVAG